MQNTNNTFNNFPANSEEYFDNKVDGMSNHQWLFDPTNPHYFPFWVSVLINKIHILSLMKGWTFFKLRNLPALLPKSITKCIDTLSTTLNRLVVIDVLDMRVIKKNKQYKVNWAFLHSINIPAVNYLNTNVAPTMIRTIFEENFPESPFDLINYEDEFFPSIEEPNNSNRSLSHQADDFHLSDPIILESDKIEPLITLDPLEVEIKQEFEAITGKTLNLKKNRKPLTELKEIAKQAKDIVLLAFRSVANHIAETGTKVYNLGYVLTTAKNLMQPKASPKTPPRNYVPSSEQDKAYASIGGDPAKDRQNDLSLETSEQKTQRLKQESQAIQLQLKQDALRTELFNALVEQDKNELIEMELDYLKTQSVWEKLKPKWPWFDNTFAVNYVIDRIKDYLLQEYLVTQPSG